MIGRIHYFLSLGTQPDVFFATLVIAAHHLLQNIFFEFPRTITQKDKNEKNNMAEQMDMSFFKSQGQLFLEAVALEKIDDTELNPEEPYKSKYAARKIYETILQNLTAAASAETTDSAHDPDRLLACRLTTLIHLGVNAYETEEVSDGERHLRQCLDALHDE